MTADLTIALDALRRTIEMECDRSLRNQSKHRLEQRVLAGAVVSYQAEYLAALDRQIDAVDRFDRTVALDRAAHFNGVVCQAIRSSRSEEHTSELQSLMRISYAVFCLKKKSNRTTLY